MWRILRLLTAASSMVGPALPDIINVVSVNAQVSGSGVLTVACGLGTPGCQPGPPFAHLDTPYSFSGDFFGSGFAVSPLGNVFIMSGSVGQILTETSDSLNITSLGLVAGVIPNGFASDSSSLSIGFELTAESIMGLMASGQINPPSSGTISGVLLDSMGNAVLPDLFTAPQNTVLDPGLYRLDLSEHASTYFHDFGGNQEDFFLGVDAKFTPVVPEPQHTFLGALLAIIIGGKAVSRRFFVR